MPEFIINKTIETPEPTIDVSVTPDKPLPRGKLTFQLVVTDDSGNVSKPSTVTVTILDDQLPTAILTAPTSVPFGKAFSLSGERSTDLGGGKIVKYAWTYLGPAG
jgi:chitodextrinase